MKPGFSTLAQDAIAQQRAALDDFDQKVTVQAPARADQKPAAPAQPLAPPRVGVRRLLNTLTSSERKEYPIVTGCLDYFPDALTMVAHISYLGNQKHNPGQALHWARGKSMDHEDCIGRHTVERDVVEEGVLHAANRAWRALAALQEALETKYDLDPPRGATVPSR